MDVLTKNKVLGELESEIMKIVWDCKSPVSVKAVTENLQKNRKIAYTTVMTIMGRLVEKGLLKRKTSGKAYDYQATYTKDRFLTKATRQIIKNFVSSFGDGAIAHFAQEVDKMPAEKKKKLVKILKESEDL